MIGDDCDCEFDYPDDEGGLRWQYLRTCQLCGQEWGALHCPHDGVQNPCPTCGWIAPGARTPLQFLGFEMPPDAGQ
jgi:hypothetical protein